jgi:hypothetical protein
MSRDQQVDEALDSILEQSRTEKPELSTQQQIYNVISNLSESELLKLKKQVDHLVEKKEGERRRMRERLTHQRDMDSLLDGLL